nr:hypothetical protein [Tanacetum cinerariifolium]
ADLSQDEKLLYDSAIKAVNILLLGFPVDIYSIINHYQNAKEIWDRIKELIEGTEMTKQERESKLYGEFDKSHLSLDLLADSLEKTNDCENLQLQAIVNFKADHVDAYDSDCDDEAIANAIFIEILSLIGSINDDTVEPRYDSDILFGVPYYDTYHEFDVLNSDIQELELIENIVSNTE